ncbi:MAG: fibronectin type III domain-containing protein [Thermoanaerobaculaceae bacterium]|nr:fibronectin type III domain-containing protein [Thermoanaerobaculaceae bacterium]
MRFPDAAFAKYGYLATGTINGYANYVSALGCNYDYSPPSCPESPMAYSITGTSATISWLPSVEDATDIAYYILYRNNSEIAKTSETFYNDSGLATNTTYKYDIRAVNAAQLTTTGCSNASMYLKTNATLTLMVNKNDPNAKLTWNDEGLNNYNVFMGTSPQVMTLIGNTSEQVLEDPNVLLDNVNYFYTVDDPGQ